MSVRLNFIVEGQTEETFVNRALRPYLADREIWVSARCIATGKSRRRRDKGGSEVTRKPRGTLSYGRSKTKIPMPDLRPCLTYMRFPKTFQATTTLSERATLMSA